MNITNMHIPEYLTVACGNDNDRKLWLKRLPLNITEICLRWELKLGAPIVVGASCSWVSHCLQKDHTPAILKFGMPHFEGEHEIDGLKFWNGEPTVLLLNSDEDCNAMLLESCRPGTPLKKLTEHKQDEVLADILNLMWKQTLPNNQFRDLSTMISYWADGAMTRAKLSPDKNFTLEGIKLFRELGDNSKEKYLLATDLHANNVLSSKRKPWLAIDPKPFIGDPAYDATQHFLNCPDRLANDPLKMIQRFSSLLGLDWKRIRLWTFARLAMGIDPESHLIARKLKV